MTDFEWSAWDGDPTDAAIPLHLDYATLPVYAREIVYDEILDAEAPEDVPKWIQTLIGAPASHSWTEAHRLDEYDAAWNAAHAEDSTRDVEARREAAAQEVENRRAERRLRATEAAHETLAQEKADAAGIRPVRAMAVTAADMMTAAPPPALIEGVLDGGGLSMLVGTRGTGRSFVALDMALAIATGRPWAGRATTSASRRVLYLVGEGGGRAFGIRIEAWCNHHGVDPGALDGAFLAIDGAVPFMSSRWDELLALVAEFDPEHVVIDTLSRHAVGLEENSNSDAATGVARAEALRDRTGCSVMVLHHPAKGVTGGVNAGRGAGAWEAAVDTVLVLEPAEDDALEIDATKQKHRPEGRLGYWQLVPVRVTPNGTWDTSVVPVPVDPLTLPSALAVRTTAEDKAAAVDEWILDAVAADPGRGASAYYRAKDVTRQVDVEGVSVPFSKADAEAAIDRLVASGRLVRNTADRRRQTLTVASGGPSEGVS
ncbi:AAA family ATPase [Rhodococcus kroppenstedtii]|uniref:AAA family ATPase n=1 Tax=Rhodococcoides kroppenstedtii TaxID=293050 RepID=UPI002954AEF9|nr:AAA family ATPase [Rhodococcus kroppenstedtii]MDV7198103.1 AAA family ATPase [Rhodococcus kroppenstedtii]